MYRKILSIRWEIFMVFLLFGCSAEKSDIKKSVLTGVKNEVKLITLDPGHFHAALVQKIMYQQVDPLVHVFAPQGDDVQMHLKRINNYNNREDNPTKWEESVYTGADFLEKLIAARPGNVVVISGNNKKKTEYIHKMIAAGLNVLADKPMAINTNDFDLLKETFTKAAEQGVLLYDIMTERFEITTVLQKELSRLPEVFGQLKTGSPEEPSVTKESVHHYFKYVSGSPLQRPPWYFDVSQQGEGIVDVTTHLVDMVQWACFPDQVIDYEKDIDVLAARRWPTVITAEQFKKSTGLETYPDYLIKDISENNSLEVYANGDISYKIRGIHARVSVIWNFQAPEGAGDTHFSIMRGSKANLIISQAKEENYKPQLYIETLGDPDEKVLRQAIDQLSQKYPGVGLQKTGARWRVEIPEKYHIGHEAHFGQVTEKFLQYLREGKLPDWEVPNMLAKYYTTTRALQIAETVRK
jgi:predicted dehydrogenase